MMCKLCDGLLEKKGNQAVEAFQRYYSKQERERIIELLQGMQETAFSTGTDKGKQTGWVLENAIVLIKENK